MAQQHKKSNMNLIGRIKEQEYLLTLLESDRAEFLAVYGRRRIGKTYLIKQFFSKKECVFFNSIGIKDGNMKTQINRFVKEIGQVFYKGTEIKEQKNWLDTFDALTDAIAKFVPVNKKVVLFFDEFPWMETHKAGLLQALDYIWNKEWSNNPKIKLILCGSSASWIINKIINNKAGLHNRITKKIQLMPFNLKETNEFLANKKVTLNKQQITQIYMTTGGVPYYLKEMQKGLSATQLVDKLAFHQNSLLFKEFDNLFSSLFNDSETYIELLRIIAKNKSGTGQEEIIKKSKHSSRGGRVIKKLSELEEAGFIISFKPHFHKKRGIYYRLIDEYTLFYLEWIEPIRNTLQKNSLEAGYWEGKCNSGKWNNWAGYAFEAICYKHLSQIRNKLQISPSAIANGWRYVPTSKTQEDGAQIDLLFDRDDNTITLCEIKYTDNPFEINKNFAAQLQRKAAVFREKTRTKKHIFISMVSANGLKETMYSEEIIQACVTIDDLFK